MLGDDVFPFTTLTGNVYDSGDYMLPLRTAAAGSSGYDRAAGRAGGAACARRPHLLGIGVAVVRRDHRRGRRRRRVRRGRGARRRLGHGVRRHVGARSGPPDGLRHARRRPDRHRRRSDPPRRRRHRPGAARRRHRWLTLIAARRLRGARCHRSRWSTRRRDLAGHPARSRRRRHRGRRRRRHGRRRRRARHGADVGRARGAAAERGRSATAVER